jgi:probable phosphoglycerate mutase
MLLYLARHAQTASSAVDSFNGQRELPLTEEGRDQATRLGQRLFGVPFSAVYRSPLGRTGESANLAVPNLPALIVPGLIEIDYGEWEGLGPKEVEARYPARYHAWVSEPERVGPPGGETVQRVADRALAALEFIRARHEEGNGGGEVSPGPAIAFSHKATLRVLACALSGAPLSSYRRAFAQDECALNLVELRKGKAPFIRLWNDTSHLGPDPGATTRGGK